MLQAFPSSASMVANPFIDGFCKVVVEMVRFDERRPTHPCQLLCVEQVVFATRVTCCLSLEPTSIRFEDTHLATPYFRVESTIPSKQKMISNRHKWEHQPLALQREPPNDEHRMKGCWILSWHFDSQALPNICNFGWHSQLSDFAVSLLRPRSKSRASSPPSMGSHLLIHSGNTSGHAKRQHLIGGLLGVAWHSLASKTLHGVD